MSDASNLLQRLIEESPGISRSEAGLAASTAATLKAVADPARLRILAILASSNGPLAVSRIVPLMGLSQPTISHHLRILHEAGLVDREKQGVWMLHTLDRDRLRMLADMIGQLAGRQSAKRSSRK